MNTYKHFKFHHPRFNFHFMWINRLRDIRFAERPLPRYVFKMLTAEVNWSRQLIILTETDGISKDNNDTHGLPFLCHYRMTRRRFNIRHTLFTRIQTHCHSSFSALRNIENITRQIDKPAILLKIYSTDYRAFSILIISSTVRDRNTIRPTLLGMCCVVLENV